MADLYNITGNRPSSTILEEINYNFAQGVKTYGLINQITFDAAPTENYIANIDNTVTSNVPEDIATDYLLKVIFNENTNKAIRIAYKDSNLAMFYQVYNGTIWGNWSIDIFNLEIELNNLSNTQDKIEIGLTNPLDVGGLFLVNSLYTDPIVDGIPCSGGLFRPTAYTELFSKIGYGFGSGMAYDSSKLLYASGGSGVAVDPVTGYAYVAVGIMVYVYDETGSFVRTGTPYSGAAGIQNMVAYNNWVICWTLNSSAASFPAVSTDAGFTWTYSSTYFMGTAGSAHALGIGSMGAYGLSNYTSGDSGNWSYYTAFANANFPGYASAKYWLTWGPGKVFTNYGGVLYVSTSLGSWEVAGSVSGLLTVTQTNVNALIIGDYLYALNSSYHVLRININDYSYTDTGLVLSPSAYLRDMVVWGDLLMLITSNTGYIYFSQDNGVSFSQIMLSVAFSEAPYRCSVVNGVFYVFTANSTRYVFTATPAFKTPNISISNAIVFIRTKNYLS